MELERCPFLYPSLTFDLPQRLPSVRHNTNREEQLHTSKQEAQGISRRPRRMTPRTAHTARAAAVSKSDSALIKVRDYCCAVRVLG